MRAGDRVTFPYHEEGMDGTATVRATILSMGDAATVASEHTIYEVDLAILTVTEAYPIGKKFDPWKFLQTGER